VLGRLRVDGLLAAGPRCYDALLEDPLVCDWVESYRSSGTWEVYLCWFNVLCVRSKLSPSQLLELNRTMNIKSIDGVVSYLVSEIMAEFKQAAVEEVMRDTVPVILTGVPNAGKTFFLREKLLPSLNGDDPVLVVDVHGEYPSLEQIDLGKFYALDFKAQTRKLRFIPNADVDVSKSEVAGLIAHLVRNQKFLAHWTIVVEEGHHFEKLKLLRDFMAESRKHTRKLIVVSHQVEPFKGLGRILGVHRAI